MSAADTPLMKQYNAIKAKYPGALLLFRVGDFYETFGEDAIKASAILDIVLTKRGNGSASETALAGFPHHSLDTYLPKLVRAGNRVAICDQLEDPKMVKGIVKRGVTELVTPGVSFNDHVLEKRRNNFLASVYNFKDLTGAAFLDISTGEFFAAQGTSIYIEKLVQGFNPAEIIYAKGQYENLETILTSGQATFGQEDWIYSDDFAREKLLSHFKTINLKGFGLDGMDAAIIAAGATLHYLESTEHKELGHIASISRIEEEKYVWLDRFTVRNLELVHSQHEGGVALLNILDQTLTPMGARLLRQWILLPLRDVALIQQRQRIVAALNNDPESAEIISENLKEISDLERLISKVATGRVNPRELNQLKKSLKAIEPIRTVLNNSKSEDLRNLNSEIKDCTQIISKIENELQEDAPMLLHQGGVIREGIDSELDELRRIAFSGKDYLLQVQKREIERTGISSLKISYNKVFGYYLEVSNANKDKVPADWIRKQTLVNAERYITEELKVYEEKIISAEEKIGSIELRIFQNLIREVGGFTAPIQQNAKTIGTLDCLLSFSMLSAKNNYVLPEISESTTLSIKAGRHPVIEKQLGFGESYVPNDVYLDNDSQQILIITGPNMAGKSALLRQTALIVLMAQIGSFVPAEAATIGIVDKIFTRVGASDNLSKGESTFMVEMTETASILNNLSNRSLVLMDEIGRGTSTYDGVSIAWAIVEYLHNHPEFRAKTLFATHYHELNQLSEDLVRVKNFNVSVKEVGDKILFMRKLKPGGSEHSFGIHVARLAGMPNKIVIRANDILHFLEKDKQHNENRKPEVEQKSEFQLSLFDVDPRLKKLDALLATTDINTISPVEALLKLNEVITLLKKNPEGKV